MLNRLNSEFEITLGNVTSFVDLQINRYKTNKIMFIDQEMYALQILNKFNFSKAKPVSVPADVHIFLKSTEDTSNRVRQWVDGKRKERTL